MTTRKASVEHEISQKINLTTRKVIMINFNDTSITVFLRVRNKNG